MPVQYKRITNAQAKKRFAQDEPIYLCPCKCHPDSPWNLACLILGKEYMEQARMFMELDKQPITEQAVQFMAWGSMLANWNYYNANSELGYYPHYYVQVG